MRIGQWALRFDQLASAFNLGDVGNLSPDAPSNVEGDGFDFPVTTLAVNFASLPDCLRLNGIGFGLAHFSGDEQLELGTYEFQP